MRKRQRVYDAAEAENEIASQEEGEEGEEAYAGCGEEEAC